MNLAELQSRLDAIPLHRLVPLQALAVEPAEGVVTLGLSWRPEYDNGAGAAHGGVLAMLADTAASFALIAHRGAAGPTVDLRLDFLKAARPGETLAATAMVRRAGRTLAFIDVEVRDSTGALVALGRANCLAPAP